MVVENGVGEKIGIGGKRELGKGELVVGRYSIFCKETPHKGLVLYLSTRLAILSQNIFTKAVPTPPAPQTDCPTEHMPRSCPLSPSIPGR